MAKNIWLNDNFMGGVSDDERRGIRGSFAWGESLDFRTNPGVLTGNSTPVKDTTTIIEGLPKWIVQLGSDIFAYDAGNKIYKKGAPWTKVYTNAQTGIGNGMAVMGTNLYYASNAKLGKDDGTFGAPTPTVQTFANGAANSWHPMKVFSGAGGLCIGDGRNVAVLDYDGVTFDDDALILPLDTKVKCLEVWNEFLVIGTYKGTNVYDDNLAEIYFWDGTASTYNYKIELNESGIHSLLTTNNGLMFSAGVKGNMYLYNGGTPVKIKQIPLQAPTVSSYSEIYPDALTNFQGRALIGTAGTGNSATSEKAVWSWGSNNKNYPNVLNLDYFISTGTKVGATTFIGTVKAVNDNELYIGWRDGASYGIDLVNSNNRVAAALYRTLYFDAGIPFVEKEFKTFFITFDSDVAANETITLKYRKDSDSAFTSVGVLSSAGPNFYEFNYSIQARRIQLQLEFAGSNNTLCDVTSIGAIYDVKQVD